MLDFIYLNELQKNLSNDGVRPHILYFLRNNETGLTKIGITYTLKCRFKALMKECATKDFDLIYAFSSCVATESLAKVFFTGRDVYREWYFLSAEEIETFIDHCASAIQSNASDLKKGNKLFLFDQHYVIDTKNNLIKFYVKNRNSAIKCDDYNKTLMKFFAVDVFSQKKYGTYKKLRQPRRKSVFTKDAE